MPEIITAHDGRHRHERRFPYGFARHPHVEETTEPDAGWNTVHEAPEGSVARDVADGFAEASAAEGSKTVALARRQTFSMYSDWSKPLLRPCAWAEATTKIAMPPEEGQARRHGVAPSRELPVAAERPLRIVSG